MEQCGDRQAGEEPEPRPVGPLHRAGAASRTGIF